MSELHYIQLDCLFELSQVSSLRFSDFETPKKLSIDKDKFNYHLQTIVRLGLVSKKSSLYSLTTEGKQFISRYDFINKQPEKYPKLSVMIRIFKNEKRDTLLVSKRLKHPCLNQYSLVTGKVKRGEYLDDAMKRECYEETGLNPIKYSLMGIRRIFDFDDKELLLHDAIFFEYEVLQSSGSLIEKTNEAENSWIAVKDIKELDNALSSVKNVLRSDLQLHKQFIFIDEESYVLHTF